MPLVAVGVDSIELSGRRLGTMAELETELRDMLAARSDHTVLVRERSGSGSWPADQRAGGALA